MGEEIAVSPDTETNEQTDVTEPTEPVDQPVESGDETGEDGEENQEPQENEVFLDGDDGSQPDKQQQHVLNSILAKRRRKLNKQKAKAKDEVSQVQQQLVIEQERNKLLSIALDQQQQNQPVQAVTPPDPGEYDDGVSDPKYIKDLQDYTQPQIVAEVQRQTAHLAKDQTPSVSPDLERKQVKHYERADKLKIKNFEEFEDKALAILGNDMTNFIIQSSDKSELILYHLGRNTEEAEALVQTIAEHPGRGVFQIAELAAKLGVRPKVPSETIPDPDEELSGGTPAAGKTNRHQRAVDDAREAARDGKGMQAVLDAKKKAKEAGVTVI